jgi:hypothetical protein
MKFNFKGKHSWVGVIAYDAELREPSVFRPLPYLFLVDNSMQAEQCLHTGLTVN